MKQEFLCRAGNQELAVVFGGWGAGPELFRGYPLRDGCDLLLCYDYKDIGFDYSVFEGYLSCRILGWSMGVWAGQKVLQGRLDGGLLTAGASEVVNCRERTAFGGTPWPVSDAFGIPEAVFRGTLENLSVGSLYKFRRRMCGRELAHFEEHMPHRRIEDLRDELEAVWKMAGCGFADGCASALADGSEEDFVADDGCVWNRAVVGRGDLIFPVGNQVRAWERIGVPVRVVDGAHYAPEVFAEFLEGEVDYDR